jgi:hypothetical protein
MNTSKVVLLTLSAFIAAAMSGCSGGNDSMPQSDATPQPRGEGFTAWSKSAVFNAPAEGAPVVMDSLSFNFDGNDDPNAYAELLPPSM